MNRIVVTLAALVVIIAGLKAAASLVVPFILSLFITMLLSPLLQWLMRQGVPKVLAFILVIFFVFVLFVSLTGLVTSHVADLFTHAEDWQAAMTENLHQWMLYLDKRGFHVDQELFFSMLQPQKLFVFTLSLVKNTSMMLSNSLLIFFTVVFMLIESFTIKKKIRYIETFGVSGFSKRIDAFSERINHYFTLKALTSAVTGIWIVAVLYWFDIPYPLLWGIGGFILNFIPVIGSIIAAIPPVLLALATHGFSDAFWVAGWFLVINIAIGNLLEPRIMGKGLELSELVVFLSLVFWGWVFGKVGMLLAVPLTMVVKFALETNESTRWIAIMLSDTATTAGKRMVK
ncbi:AI-2E family transporter [Hydrogenimonas urashimensis]|uniref:AI-2E family transporter n=1 Tax=Hydrogenimonas urashimensis TaxID=2740515 RepID=UPI0019163BB5|nr:AI-2E family transporter [Hydrogenimonas urashimensis]